MRKNGVNRELRKIAGGVCAPAGFRANGMYAGFTIDPNKKDLALVVSDRRCPTACVFSAQSGQSGPACSSKRHVKKGFARAILVNSGVANVFLPDGERLAELACRALAARSDIDANDTVIASTGKIGGEMTLEPFENNLRALYQGLEATEEASLRAAEAIMTTDSYPKHTAYEFDLGDFPCKIGALFKGCVRVAPNMATTLIFLTTDVNISSEMLQKALHLTVKDTVNLLYGDGISSPNDTVCIMASGRAGNYKISNDDTEFAKFTVALKKVLSEICRCIAKDCDKDNQLFICKVLGAKSQPAAYAVAKKLVASHRVRQSIIQETLDVDSILYAICEGAADARFSGVQISMQGNGEEYIVYEDNGILPIAGENLSRLAAGAEITLCVSMRDGNYTATAFGALTTKGNL